MSPRRRDTITPDLFKDFTPPSVVERFSPERVRAVRASARIKRAVAEAIKDSKHGRDAIAHLMSEQLGEKVTVALLDQYTSTANEAHNIPAHRLVALFSVTGDVRLINALLADTDVIAIAAKYEPLIRREMAKEALDLLQREIGAADAEWKAGR
ncbi:MAG: hypothetical protein Q7V17_15015 [Afipia sp.]|nr:hypothetical protein [Afipia sp.]